MIVIIKNKHYKEFLSDLTRVLRLLSGEIMKGQILYENFISFNIFLLCPRRVESAQGSLDSVRDRKESREGKSSGAQKQAGAWEWVNA